MGKLVTVKSAYSYVLLPNKNGDGTGRNYAGGDTVTLTDAEYASLNAATLAAITLTTSGLPDPYRKSNATNAGVFGSATATSAAGVTLTLGANFVQAPATGVTYSPGYLTIAKNDPTNNVNGPTPGSLFVVRVTHKQGATSASTAPTAKNWIGGNYRTDTVGTTNTSTTVTDTSIQATDVGRTVTGTGIPAGATISSVTPGTSFVLSAAATATGTVSAVLSPLTLWPGGTVATFTASTNALDFFEFVTYDGGSTYLNTITTKGFA